MAELPSPHPSSDWLMSGGIRTLTLIAVTIGSVAASTLLLWPFLASLVWALALAVLFAPVHQWLLRRLKRPNLATAIALLLIAVIVVVPLSLIGERLVGEAAKGAASLEQSLRSGDWRRAVDASPRLAPVAQWIEDRVDLAGIASTAASWVTSVSTALLRASAAQIVAILLTFYVLYFFLRDRDSILDTLRTYSPLTPGEMTGLFDRVGGSLIATLYGTLTVALVQGALGGLMFWFLDLPSPLMWGTVMGLMSIVPVLGTFVIWAPAAIYLAMQDNYQSAIILAVWGAVVVSNIDNILYPLLVGSRLQLHNVVAFIAVVGGVVVFGLSGIILGPLIVTLTLFLLETWRARLDAAQVKLAG
jgi:predicted PurR-regulated permease PerM